MPSMKYRTYPKSIKKTLIYVKNNKEIRIKELVDELSKKSTTDVLLDFGHCLYKGLIIFNEDDVYNLLSVSPVKSVLVDIFSGTDYNLVLDIMYEKNIQVRVSLTDKGVEYLNHFNKERYKYYAFPIIVVISIVILALISLLFG